LGAEGVHLGLISRTNDDLLDLKNELKSYPIKIATVSADVAKLDQVNSAVESIQKELGAIDILINNAGIAKFGKFLELEPSEWEDQIKVNLFGVYYVTRAVLAQMIERQTGDIVNISSSAGLKGSATTSAYSASKFGVMGLSESLMQEVRKHNIRVMALNPSTVVTDLAIKSNLINNN
jgi:3-oxoacyl-[acyl-carrier protein] reductase